MADYDLKSITPEATFTDGTSVLFGADGQTSGTPAPYTSAAIKAWIQSWSYGLPARPATGISNVYSVNAGQMSLLGMTNLRFYMVPIPWFGGTVNTIAYTITTAAAAGTQARVGLYNIKSDGTPGTLISEPTASAPDDATVTGTKTFSVGVNLAPGWYYGAFAVNGNPTLAASNDSIAGPLGASLSGAAIGVVGCMLFRTLGALSAFSDESANTFSLNSAGTARPIIGIK
jgi:hypothetical protein